MVIVQCKVCNKTFDSRGMGTHVKVVHNLNYRTDYLGEKKQKKSGKCKCGCGEIVNRNWALGHWIRLNNPMHNPNKTYRHTKETIEKIRIANIGYKHSNETREKMKGPKPSIAGNNNPSKREDVKQILREIRTVQLLKADSTANYNETACKVFDKLNVKLGWNGQHALNGGEKIVKGFWLDYYEPTHNIVIEWDEPFHYDSNGKLRERDMKRQHIIENELKCNFIRIKQDNFSFNKFVKTVTVV